MISRKEAAKLLGISGDAVYHYAKTGRLKTVSSEKKSGTGRLLLYDEEDVLKLKKEMDAARGKKKGRKPRRGRLPRLESKRTDADVQPKIASQPAVAESKPPDAEKPSLPLPRHYKVQVYIDADIVEELERKTAAPVEECINDVLRAYMHQGKASAGDYVRLIEDERFIQAVTERVSERMARAVAARASV